MLPGKPILYALAALTLAALIALGVGWGLAAYRGALADAREAAEQARDAHWTAQIAKSNAEVAQARLAAQEAAVQADAMLRAADARESQLRSELEARNAALPDAAAPGLSRERVCLISPASCADGNRAPRSP